ncbi:hypothetical protein L211DRAFT_853881 [Terfezia boudieri ATCC MYA-4762]|uniref:DEAD/DEAH-box helicase domain-containing protein n=1 Tax=Terfezia boudieri ATCC MYA-4762 TaxID=1051890 RepID=A0A3N4L7X7_9PEZI|nr:hypothetical protein L211DRAFT_853881 [Terfezia boudieri ATCC MYA-4762]
MAPGIQSLHLDELGPDLAREEFKDSRENHRPWESVDYDKRNKCAQWVRRVEHNKNSIRALRYRITRVAGRNSVGSPNGHDVACVVATGKGKTMVAVVYAALFPRSYILFVSPLVALMQEQVGKFKNPKTQKPKGCPQYA